MKEKLRKYKRKVAAFLKIRFVMFRCGYNEMHFLIGLSACSAI